MKQTVASREDVDEGAELGDVDNLPVVLGTDLCFGWEGDLHHPLLGSREGGTVG